MIAKLPNNLKVMMLTSSFPLSQEKASGIFILRLVEQLSKDFDITVITPSPSDRIKPDIDQRFLIKCFRYAPKSLQILAHQPGGIPVAIKQNRWLYLVVPVFMMSMAFASLCTALKVDIIHANWAANGFIAGIAGFIARKPVVTTLRGADVTRALQSPLDHFFLKRCLRFSDKIVTVSDAIQKIIKENHPQWSNKVITIPNGVDQEFISVGAAREYKANAKVRFVTIGSLIPRKKIETLLYALTKIKVSDIAELRVIGNGPQAQFLKELTIQLNLSGCVHFLGPIPHTKIPDYLQDSDVFVLCSTSEGRPNVLLEAMASGLPVIASNIDGIRELIEDGKTGLLFDVGDPEQLAKKIELLIEDSTERSMLGQGARNFIIENDLTWNNAAARYCSIYKEILRVRQVQF
jgi:glycosyltransferase involved in cell wall biosynthesis